MYAHHTAAVHTVPISTAVAAAAGGTAASTAGTRCAASVQRSGMRSIVCVLCTALQLHTAWCV
jgi:uncharacterized membrane protein YfcA